MAYCTLNMGRSKKSSGGSVSTSRAVRSSGVSTRSRMASLLFQRSVVL